MEKKFVVYKSSAGSGKTFTLVKEYLKICLSSDNPMKFREILAITFTNKAAAEMKSRVISALQELSVKSSKQLALQQILLEEIGLDVEQMTKRAENILTSILHNYADFSVSTIDQFTFRLIRSFARELQIPLNFEVEMDKDNLLNKVIALLIDKVGHEEKLSKVLIKFTQSKMDEEKYYDIEREIKDFSSKLLSESAGTHLANLRPLDIAHFTDLHAIYQKQNRAFEQKLSDMASSTLTLIESNGIEHSSFSRSSIPTWLMKIGENEIAAYENIEKALNYCEERKLYPVRASQDQKQAIDSIAEELTSHFREMHELYTAENALYNTRAAALKSLYSLALLNEIEKLLEQIKKEEGVIHISDFNKKIFSVVDAEPVPFIYERIGEKYKHFMVDEFQDTSVLQYQNLLPLIENSLAEENFNMLVGDSKQAIYRWRGGEVEQFSGMPEYLDSELTHNQLYLERQQSVSLHFNEKNLNANFRSTKTVVEFNNSFFASLTEGLSERIQQIYKNHQQEVKAIDKVGFVSARFLPVPGFQEATLSTVLEHINECVEAGYAYKDIAILCRKRKQGSLLANFLSLEGIKVISSESLLLSNSPEVNFLVKTLRFIVNTKDVVAKTYMIEFLCQQNSEDLHTSYLNTTKSDESFQKFLSDRSEGFSVSGIEHLPLYELCEKLVRNFNLHRTYDVYIQSFLEQVHQFQLTANSGVSSFLEWWEEKNESIYIDAPESVDAVQIMTVHKSKGLEFPIVIFPFAHSDYPSRPSEIWVNVDGRIEPALPSMIISSNATETVFEKEVVEEHEKIMMDEINVLYVAMTRAVDRLYIVSKELPKKIENLKSISKLLNKGLSEFEEYVAEEGIFEIGERVPKSTKQAPLEEVQFPEFISTDWRNKLSISLEAPAEWGNTESLTPLQYGNMMHKILSEITVVEDVDSVVSDFSNRGLLSSEESDGMMKELNELLSDKQIARYFQKGTNIKVEKDIITPTGRTYRPDRVVYLNNQITVIDFKSGAEEEIHKEQVRNYANLISAIEGQPTKASLIYLGSKKIVEVELGN